ncbi:tail fiber domain-containing protein [Phreatobacter stygius]|uniref:Peptidase S74 domain-containing protein n=1 Tax=Phreatobacter stygius TaxID=1940610 RepID=A0A4D7B5X9_9HYPH|nr:tail fiber domain-containing protein [Phreatobacter stygius]QCI65530.1 hypothetical protein E8M01_15740 [Phreatobacter stygius]
MPIRFEKYRIKDGDFANAATVNPILKDLDVRTAAIEDKAVSFDQEKAKFVSAGLARLDEIMAPIVENLNDYASLGAILTTSSASQIEVSVDRKVFIVDADHRRQFAPAAYLAMIKTGEPTEAMLGSLVAYDPTSGELTIDVDRAAGSGFHAGWTISAASATDNAAAIPAVHGHRVAAEAAAVQALSRRDEAAQSSADALAARDVALAEAAAADSSRNQAQIAQGQTETAAAAAIAHMRGFLGVHTSPPATQTDGTPLAVGNWYFHEVPGPPATYYIDFVASIAPVTWRSLVAASDTSVTSFNGRVGGVNPTAGDYSAALVTGTAPAGLSGTTVQAILNAIGTGLAARPLTTRTVTGSGLASGGGDLTADRAITVTAASQAQAIAGSDNATAMTPLRTAEAIAALAPSASQTVAGIVRLATGAEATAGTSTTLAVDPAGLKQALDAKIAAITGAAPAALDTFVEFANALGNDPNFATTITTSLATKLPAASYSAADVMAKLQTVDGAGSGLDADLIDGQHAAAFALGATTITAGTGLTGGGTLAASRTLAFDSAWGDARYALGTTAIAAGTGLSGGGSLAASRSLAFDTAWGDARYAVKAGAALSGAVTLNGRLSAIDTNSTAMATATGGLGSLEIRSSGATSAAMIGFHRPNAFAAYFGLDSDNQWKVGGWSTGALAYTLWHSGNFTPAGYFNNQVSAWKNTNDGHPRMHFENAGPSTWRGYGSWFHQWQDGAGAVRAFLEGAGNFYATGNVVAYYSDRRLKDEIRPIDDWRAIIEGIRGVRFRWNGIGRQLVGEAEAGQDQVGFIAQEVASVLPQGVAEQLLQYQDEHKTPRTDVPVDPADPYLTVRPEKLIPVLVQAVKGLMAEVDSLKANLAKEVA